MSHATITRRSRRAPAPGQASLFDFGAEPEPAPRPAPAAPVLAAAPPAGDVARVRANLAALATLRALQAGHRPATGAELAELAAWSGWGAVPGVFDPARPAWAWARDQLAGLLTPEEYRAASASTLNAHYTGPAITGAIWEAVTALGFTGGAVIEPGCGSGNFIATAPAGASVTGIEVEPITAAIAAARCPGALIRCESYAVTRYPAGHFDLAIGNVPFGKIALHDPAHNPARRSIHNHFILKSLALLRPGGLAAFVTSRYTLDSGNDEARRELAGLADLIAAVRLPATAHQATAGTSVVTDVLILRRREEDRDPAPAGWLAARPVVIDGHTILLNEHYTAHPAAILGTLATGRGYRADDLTVKPAGDLAPALAAALAEAIEAARGAGLTWSPRPRTAAPQPPAPEPAPQGAQDGRIERRRDGTFSRCENGVTVPHQAPGTQRAELAALLALRDAALAVLDEETATTEDTPQLAQLRADLGTAYGRYHRAYGPLNRTTARRTGRTDPATGAEIIARARPPMGGFRTDPHAPLVFALEEYDAQTGTAERAPIFTRRVIAPRTPPATAESPADALAVSMDMHGRPDLGTIARLLGVDRIAAREALAGLVFNDPASTEGRELIPAAEYLSGDVRAKLAAAEAAAATDDRYAENVAALAEVIPADLTAAEIDARLGAAWISGEYVEQFLREILDNTWLTVEHPGGQVWDVNGGDYGIQATSTWGTRRYPAGKLTQAILEQRKIEVRDPIGEGKYIPNLEETAAANEKAAELQERFGEWAWEDPERARELARIYNERFNSLVLRSYDGARLTLPGLSAAAPELHPHQHAAVARMIAEPAVLLAHEVGAGKTMEMICGAMELRRLGLVKKPCVVVPNHMLDQFAGEWLRTYPRARVLITRKEDLTRDNRRRLVARIATGEWDAVIMTRSTFERIPLSAENAAAYLDQETERLRAWLGEAREGAGRTVKRLEAALLRAVERVKAKLDSKKDPGITFEQTGIDYLIADEAHAYKNLRTPSSISDAAIDGSQRASDIDMKICYLRNRDGSRVVTYATATPVANSMTEMYVMQRYLRPDLLEAAGIEVFDTWAATFGELVTEVELAPEGGGSFRQKTRFARFRNVPEMLRLFHVFADVKTAEDLNLPAPDLAEGPDGRRTAQTVTVDPSPELLAYVAELGGRAQKIRGGLVRPEEDNMLKVSTDGRKAALDVRMVGYWQDAPGKIAAAAASIHAKWEANRLNAYPVHNGEGTSPARGALQLVFCDLGTPADGWNVYRELRDQLAGLGIPRGAVRFIHEAKTDRDKAELFAACRNGGVSVLIGSTEKMGTGVNVQHRAIALHHLDAPWRPADVHQRDGRILRQGNTHPEVEILRYVVARSFDGFMWQTLERKARFIAQVMRGRLDMREIEDIGDVALSYAEVKALATGNPLLMDKAAADAKLGRLRRAERAHQRNQALLAATIKSQGQRAAYFRESAAQTAAATGRRRDTRGDAFTMTVAGRQFTRRPDAAVRLTQIITDETRRVQYDRYAPPRDLAAGHLGGFDITARARHGYGTDLLVNLSFGIPGLDFELTAAQARDGASVIKRLENRLAKLEEHRADLLASAERADSEAAHARDNLGAAFPKAAELAAAEAESARIAAEMDELARQASQQQPEDEEAA